MCDGGGGGRGGSRGDEAGLREQAGAGRQGRQLVGGDWGAPRGRWAARPTVSTAQSGSCRKACRAASRCAGLAPARLACRTPLAASASPTSLSRRPQEEKTTALAVGSAARMAASSASRADTWESVARSGGGTQHQRKAHAEKELPRPGGVHAASPPRALPDTGADRPQPCCTGPPPWRHSRHWRLRLPPAAPHSAAPPPRTQHQTGRPRSGLRGGGVRGGGWGWGGGRA